MPLKNQLSQNQSESNMLAYQAKEEMIKYGKVLIVCPKCHKHPKVFHDENRLIVTCPCRYISECEICL